MDKPKRGRRGQGTIYRTKDGRYRGSISLGYKPDGITRDRRYVYGRTRAEARRKLDELIIAYNTGRLPDNPQNVTVAEYLTRWLEDEVKPKKERSTFADYETCLNSHVIPYIGRHQLTKLSPVHIQNMVGHWEKNNVSPWQRRKGFFILRSALAHAVLPLRYISENPLDGFEPPPKPATNKRRILTPEEVDKLIGAIEGDRYYALWLLEIYTGLRLGELFGIRRRDLDLIDLDDAYLNLQQAIQEVQGKQYITDGKWGSAQAVVPLPRIVAEALIEHMKQNPPDGPDGLVFTSPEGKILRQSAVRRRLWQPIVEKAGLGHIRLKDLRHTLAVNLFRDGAQLHEVQNLLRHSRASVTTDIYGQHIPKGRKTARRVERIYGGARKTNS